MNRRCYMLGPSFIFLLTMAVNVSASEIINISTRALIQGDIDNVIAGFIINGIGTQQVVVIARGKSVNMSQDFLCLDTTMSVYKMVNGSWTEIANNDDWQEDVQAANIPARFQPADPSDAALLLNLEAGAYTAIMGCNSGTGIGLISVNTVQPRDDETNFVGKLFNSNDGSCKTSDQAINFHINDHFVGKVQSGKNMNYKLPSGKHELLGFSAIDGSLIHFGIINVKDDGWWHWIGCEDGTHPSD